MLSRAAEKRAVEAQKNKKQKAEKEAKLEVLKRTRNGWQNPPVFLPRVVKQSETGLEK